MPDVNLAPYDPQQQALNRRRALAMALQQEALTPIEQPNYPGAGISWTQGAAKLMAGLVAALQNKKLDKEQKALYADQLAQRMSEASGLANAAVPPPVGGQMPVGSPQPQGFDFPGAAAPPETPPTTNRLLDLPVSADQQSQRQALVQAITRGMASPNPESQEIAKAMLTNSQITNREQMNQRAELARQLAQQNYETQKQYENQQFSAGQNALARQATANRPTEVAPGASLMSPTGEILGTAPEKTMTKPPKPPEVKFSNDGIPMTVEANDRQYVIGGPDMPPELKPIADAAIAAHRQRIQEQAAVAEAAAARAAARAADAQRLANDKAPDELKKQVSAAYQTKDQIDVIRGIVQRKPQLLGPAAGRMEQASQGIGSTFGLQNPEDEKDAATLASHLGYLFANELRAAVPGRPNREMIAELKKVSAQLIQNPNMLNGMLTGAENNANLAIQNGQRWGINPPNGPAQPSKKQGKGDPLGIR